MNFNILMDSLDQLHLDIDRSPMASPYPAIKLERAESVERKHTLKAKNRSSYSFDEFKLKGSVVPRIAIPVILHTLWGVLWTCLYKLYPNEFKNIAVPPTVITILSVVMGLLLVFRTNTAYDRYWEARRLWGTLFTHTRNLSRLIWISIKDNDSKDLTDKYGAINLLLAFAVSTKHYLRFEPGFFYEDLHYLLTHVPEFHPGKAPTQVDNMPLKISFHISSYIGRCRSKGIII